jgi:hypothetical protein
MVGSNNGSMPSRRSFPHAPRRRELLFALLEIVVAALCLYAFGAFATEHDLDGKLLSHSLLVTFLNIGEGRVATAYLITGLPAMVLLARAIGRVRPAFGEGAWLARAAQRPRASALCLAVLAALLTTAIGSAVVRHTPLTDDEWVYLFQAKCMLSGHLSAAIPHSPELFSYPFTILTPDGRLAGVYPPGQPFLIALGMAASVPHLAQVIAVAAIVYTVARLGDELGDKEVGLLAAALTAVSPFVLCAGATFHNAVPTAMCSIVALRFALACARNGSGAAIAGAAVGAAFLCRPFDGALAALAVFVIIVTSRHRGRLMVTALAGVPFVALYLASNAALTGHAVVPAYAVFNRTFGDARMFGFGRGPFGVEHTPDVAFSKSLVAIARINLWLFGWPLSLAPLVLPAFNVALPRRYWPALLLVALIFVGYFLYASSPVHDVGSIYHLAAAPLLTLLASAVLLQARRDLDSRWPLRITTGAAAVAMLAFWPLELVQLATTATYARVSVDATAGRASPIVVFWEARSPAGSRSWVFFHPLPSPDFSDRVLFVRDQGLRNVEYARRFPGRAPYRARPRPDGSVELVALVTGEL